jgi:hypothetical protein
MREKPMASIFLSKSDHLPLPQKPETDSISSQVQIITMMRITVDLQEKSTAAEAKAIAEAASSATCIMPRCRPGCNR